MIRWPEFVKVEPEMARAGHELLYEVGVGLAFLSTVRVDGGPRVHPICPLLADAGLFAFIVPSPKQRDLHRDHRYALHTIPLESNEDAFYLSGRARHVADPAMRRPIATQFVAERTAHQVPEPEPDHHLFEFLVETAVLTRTCRHGDPAPRHQIWHAPAG